jgi:phosphatidate cytidylyltransferase
MGALLIGFAGLLLNEERWFAPWFPCLFAGVSAACILGTRELVRMLDAASRPCELLCLAGVAGSIIVNWRMPFEITTDVWRLVGSVFVGTGIAAFLYEMFRFRGPDRIAERISQTLLVVFYLGVLPSFFLQLRWLDSGSRDEYPSRSTLALALTVFVPKCGDIGAFFTGKYLTGKFLGRRQMTPLLSPKKTWQGAIGGMLGAVGAALAICSIGPVLPNQLAVLGFGVSVGAAGMLGDLAESLLKRDRQTKDASASVPGFGGVLDVVDSLLFAAPVAYLWLK